MKMKKAKIIMKFLLVVIVSIVVLKKFNIYENNKELRENIYKCLQDKNNRIEVYYSGVALNNGKSENTCVYFISEVLRKNNYNVPKDMANTESLINFLKKDGWKRKTDYKKLKPGNICFTTDGYGNKKGIPTHTYIFMAWVKEESYDYAYICDNQAKDYENKIYHIRNIKNVDKANGCSKDAFSFFMEK
ncbi:hypothetical protein N072000002_20090 [Clostridium tetani]|uniref:Bacteriophage lysin domain-containing protein n=1 Tax=Clostridium tetani TaxID=1513 RepID=A0ABC8EEW0_CLOTA|nr:hypothetical protein [Clostridium tetani]BDR81826.1 hypothetical protein K234311028_20720 [Clostridium tetani]BDR90208.1 hypothetical protein N072000002_20090 [Clostridium tetani]